MVTKSLLLQFVLCCKNAGRELPAFIRSIRSPCNVCLPEAWGIHLWVGFKALKFQSLQQVIFFFFFSCLHVCTRNWGESKHLLSKGEENVTMMSSNCGFPWSLLILTLFFTNAFVISNFQGCLGRMPSVVTETHPLPRKGFENLLGFW